MPCLIIWRDNINESGGVAFAYSKVEASAAAAASCRDTTGCEREKERAAAETLLSGGEDGWREKGVWWNDELSGCWYAVVCHFLQWSHTAPLWWRGVLQAHGASCHYQSNPRDVSLCWFIIYSIYVRRVAARDILSDSFQDYGDNLLHISYLAWWCSVIEPKRSRKWHD